MEYDRALFRVYERIMEDLNASPSPLALPSAPMTDGIGGDGALAVVATVNGVATTPSGSPNRRSTHGRDDAAVASSPSAASRGTNITSEHGEVLHDVEATGEQQQPQQENDNHNATSPDGEASTATSNSDTTLRRRQRSLALAATTTTPPRPMMPRLSSMAAQQQRRHQPLPFILPIWMARKLDQRMHHHHHHHHPNNNNTTLHRMAVVADSSNAGFFAFFGLWRNIRNVAAGIAARGRQHGGTYDSVAMTAPSSPPSHTRGIGPSSTGPTTPLSTRRSYQSLSISPNAANNNNNHHRDDSTNDDITNDDDEPMMDVELQLPTLNADHHPGTPSRSDSANIGLRRRSPTRPGGGGGLRTPPPPSSSSSFNTAGSNEDPAPRLLGSSSSPVVSSPSSSSTMAISPNTMSLAQRAIQNQLRQNELRFSSPSARGGGGRDGNSAARRRRLRLRTNNNNDDNNNDSDSNDASSNDNDDDDTTNDTDDSSDDSDRDYDHDLAPEGCSQNNLYMVMRISFAVAVLHIFFLISLHVTYVGPYAFKRQQRSATTTASSDANKDGRDVLYNCVSYALATRPMEERSVYFGGEKDSDSRRRMLLEEDSGNETRRRLLLKEESGNDGTRRMLLEEEDDQIFDEEQEEEEDWDDGREGDEFLHYDFSGKPMDMDDETYSMYTQQAQGGDDDGFSGVSSVISSSSVSSPAAVAEANYNNAAKFVPLLGKDEILQIKIMYGGKCTGRCSRVHKVDSSKEAVVGASSASDAGNNHQRRGSEKDTRSLTQVLLDWMNGLDGTALDRRLEQGKTSDGDDGSGSANKAPDPSSPTYWEKPHYRFAIDDALLYLDATSASMHNIALVNVTVTERCLSTGSDDGKLTFLTAIGEFLSQGFGMDSIIINQLMFGIRGMDGAFSSGYVKSMETQERWGWHKEQLQIFEHRTFAEKLVGKLGVVFLSTLAFFLITSVTSLIVRVLTSSGVVLMFPLFTCFRMLGMPGADERILSLSYPWIGSLRTAIANGHVHPQSHLVWAHVTKIVLYYVMYEACQAAWSVVLYAKSIPEALPVWIYGFAMIWEYFSMVFVRSALSVYFFPRVTFLYFFLYHVYFYSIPYGYFDVALIPLFLFMVHAMLYTILGLEAPNSARGVISVECPREVYNRLSWPEPVAALPAEWTMFLPLNSRLSPLHDRQISNGAPNNVTEGGDAENDDDAAT